ncbi:hypothetical protein VP01_1503g1 [Puccinia sorghi]|uniref:Uncharacterized protein n=1 Tax=Puccinia sorghi TaxID=27349 RepID=A0A0L6VJL9_9BASI|nr:hypothetical protein VP01_1503g1 [Puccinia sorghi]
MKTFTSITSLLTLKTQSIQAIPLDLLDFIQLCTFLRELKHCHRAMKRDCQSRISRLDDLPELMALRAHKNRLGTLPDYFRDFPLLSLLNTSNNKFESLPSVICEIKSLDRLNCRRIQDQTGIESGQPPSNSESGASQPADTSNQVPVASESTNAAPTAAPPQRVITIVINSAKVDITDTGIDLTSLQALPDVIHSEVTNQQCRCREDQARNSATVGGNCTPADPEIDPVTFPAGIDPSLREAVLFEQDDSFISTLPPNLLAEVDAIRDRVHRRQHAIQSGRALLLQAVSGWLNSDDELRPELNIKLLEFSSDLAPIVWTVMGAHWDQMIDLIEINMEEASWEDEEILQSIMKHNDALNNHTSSNLAELSIPWLATTANMDADKSEEEDDALIVSDFYPPHPDSPIRSSWNSTRGSVTVGRRRFLKRLLLSVACQVKAFGTPVTHGIPTSSKLKTCNTGSGLSAPSVTPGKATKNRLGFQSYKSPPKRRPKHFCRMGANIVGNLFLILGCVILDEHDAGIQQRMCELWTDLAALISAYDLSGNKLMPSKADELAQWLLLAFNTMTGRTLSEEGQNLPFLYSFYSAVWNPEPFFIHQDVFIPQISAALPSNLLLDGSSNALKRPKKRRRPILTSKPLVVGTQNPRQAIQEHTTFHIRSKTQSLALICFITISTKQASKNSLLTRALSALSLMRLILTKVRPEVEVKVNFFQRALSTDVNDTNLGIVFNTAEVLNVVSANKSDEWRLNNLSLVQTLVEKSVSSKYDDLLQVQRPQVNILMFRILPVDVPTTSDPEDGEIEKISAAVTAFKQWANSATIKGGLKEPCIHEHSCLALVLLQAFDQFQPLKVDVYIHDIIRNFTRQEIKKEKLEKLEQKRKKTACGMVTVVEKDEKKVPLMQSKVVLTQPGVAWTKPAVFGLTQPHVGSTTVQLVLNRPHPGLNRPRCINPPRGWIEHI